MNKNLEICNQTVTSINSKKHPWFRVKTEYIEGYIDDENNQIWPTMKQLSLKHAIPFAYLRKIASEQKWTIEKNNYITHFEHIRQQEKIKHLAKKSTKFDERCIKIAEEGITKLEKHLCEPIIEGDEGETRAFFRVDDLELIAKTLEKFQKIGRLALGNSTDNITKSIKASANTMTFTEGLDLVSRQIKSNPDLAHKIELEILDE